MSVTSKLIVNKNFSLANRFPPARNRMCRVNRIAKSAAIPDSPTSEVYG
jgi:hypothetical protein